MAAPVGNKFWELRAKHGLDKLFKSPELLWKSATEYFEWCESNPLMSVEYVGKDAVRVEVPKMRPFTLYGLCSYLGCNTQYFKTFKNAKRVDREDFDTVITRIEETIYNQKYTGAAAGFLKEGIVIRDLGLADKKEIEVPGKIKVKFNRDNEE